MDAPESEPMLNLVMALIWLIAAAGLAVAQTIGEGLQSRGYYLFIFVALLMSAWNLVRWFLTVRSRRRRAARRAASRILNQQTRRPEPLSEPDPAFDFTHTEPPPVRRVEGPPPGG